MTLQPTLRTKSAGEETLNTFDAMAWANIVAEINVWTLTSLLRTRVFGSSANGIETAASEISASCEAPVRLGARGLRLGQSYRDAGLVAGEDLRAAEVAATTSSL